MRVLRAQHTNFEKASKFIKPYNETDSCLHQSDHVQPSSVDGSFFTETNMQSDKWLQIKDMMDVRKLIYLLDRSV